MAGKITGIRLTNGKLVITEDGLARYITIADYLKSIIDTEHLVPDAVDSTIIADDAVGGEHIQNQAISSEHITSRSILARHLSDGVALSLYQNWNEFGELKELRANEKHGYANVEER